MRRGRPGQLYRAAKTAVVVGLGAQLLSTRTNRSGLQNLASVAYLAGGLAFRFAWVEGGKASAEDYEAVVAVARGHTGPRWAPEFDEHAPPKPREPLPLPGARRAWGEALRRTSLGIERLVRALH
jgi:hypothetical protein